MVLHDEISKTSVSSTSNIISSNRYALSVIAVVSSRRLAWDRPPVCAVMLVQRPRPRRRRRRENGRVRAPLDPGGAPAGLRAPRPLRAAGVPGRAQAHYSNDAHPPAAAHAGGVPERPDRALASCRGDGAAGGPVMRDGPAELSSGVRATGSDRGAPRSTAMAASGDVRFGDDAGRPSGGVEPALPHYRPRDTRGRCDRGGRGKGGPALVGAAAKRSAGAWHRGMPHCSNEQHSIAARRRFAGRVRRHRAVLACRKSDCW